MKRFVLIFGLVWFFSGQVNFLNAQPIDSNPAVRNYFRSPLDIPMKLSANFGELRPDHWHMGLDIRTNARENLPVHAAADGYITHVGIRSAGYGRFIVINHPNGTSTLYAHLNDFKPELETYVTDQQYKQESWAVELDFTKNQFPVTKGLFIASSGNTGGSQGPHLHFEIIETASQKRLNPLLFNFYLQDFVPPTLLRLAVYDRSKSIYSQTPVLYSLKNTDSGYIIPRQELIKTGFDKISFGIQAYDRIEKGGSVDGIYSAKLTLDDKPVISFVLDSIGFEERVYMNAHIDYRYDYRGGPYLQLLTVLPGNRSNVYKEFSSDGLIQFSDTDLHSVNIDVRDAHNNISQLNFFIRYDDSLASPMTSMPASKLVPGKLNLVEKTDFKMRLPERALYDTLPSYYYKNNSLPKNALSGAHQLNDPSYPLHGEATVSIKPDLPIPDDISDKIIIQRTAGTTNIRKATIRNGWVSADFGDFGTFQVFADLIPPEINAPGKGDTINLSSSSRIVFIPTDNFAAIRKFRGELDGQWLRFTNDKGRNWIYKFDERCPYGIHELTVNVTDVAGNNTIKTWWFRREPYTPPPPKKKTVKSKKTSSKKKNKK